MDVPTVTDLTELEVELKRALLSIMDSIRANALTPECERMMEKFKGHVAMYDNMVDIAVKQAEEG